MGRHSGQEAQAMLRSIAVLLRNTTWKCGKVERLVVNYLSNHLRNYGTSRSSIKEMVQHLRLHGKQKNEFFDALRRLEKRRIISIKGLKTPKSL